MNAGVNWPELSLNPKVINFPKEISIQPSINFQFSIMANTSSGIHRKKPEEEIEEEEAFSYAIQLVTSTVLSMALQSATDLGIFDAIAKSGPDAKLSANEIAAKLSCANPDAPAMLDRVLRVLACHSIVRCSVVADEQKIGSFRRLYSLVPVAKYFAENDDGVSLGPLLALHQDKAILHSWFELKDAIREGGIPFNTANDTHGFSYLQGLDSRFNQVAIKAMINHTTLIMRKFLDSYNGFEHINTLVDVGGGLGVTLNMITSKYSHIQGINFDLPHVIEHAPPYSGVKHVRGDMFESVPKADAIFMKWILHDWNDEQCLKLLMNCYNAIPDDGKVIVVDAVLPILPETTAAMKGVAQYDVLMMTIKPGAKERTEDEFLELALGAGFSGIRYECFVCNLCVMEFFK